MVLRPGIYGWDGSYAQVLLGKKETNDGGYRKKVILSESFSDACKKKFLLDSADQRHLV
jgi:hypothetical protein